jgi:uncharacterized damage-inducible protein DinB
LADNNLEFWLRGPISEIPALLQPVAHALLQVKKELHEILIDFKSENLWKKPNGVASVGFHLQHLTGVLDRLFTYASGSQLSENQLQYLKNEGVENQEITTEFLLIQFDNQVEISLNYLKNIDPNILTETRFVGRKQLPSTVIGLIFHAAEHSTRHLGQLLVTVKTLK